MLKDKNHLMHNIYTTNILYFGTTNLFIELDKGQELKLALFTNFKLVSEKANANQ